MLVRPSSSFPEVKFIDLEPRSDERGYFVRFFCQRELANAGLCGSFVQCNHSLNNERGTLRGLHFQAPPYQEVKIIRCIRGAIYDVVVDVRPYSPTFGRHLAVELGEDIPTMLYVPHGFAHGFLTLTPNTEVIYLVSEVYTPSAEKGLLWSDPELAIAWPFAPKLVSPKDQKNLLLHSLR